MNKNYTTFVNRIQRAKDASDIVNLEISLDRLYTCGFFTNAELAQLDVILVDSSIAIEGLI